MTLANILRTFALVCTLIAASHAAANEFGEETFNAWKREVGVRLRYAAQGRRVVPTDLAKVIGQGPGRISRVLTGGHALSIAQGKAIASFLDVPAEWLLAVDIIQTAARSQAAGYEGLALTRMKPPFTDAVSYASQVRFSGPPAFTDASPSCRADLSTFTTDELVGELRARGLTIKIEP